jgi:hypothetical protein
MIRLFLLLSLPLYILDQVTKSWIVANFRLYENEQEVIPGIFWLHHAANTGVAFGMFNGTQYANYAFTAVSLAALTFIYVMHGKGLFPGKAEPSPWRCWCRASSATSPTASSATTMAAAFSTAPSWTATWSIS